MTTIEQAKREAQSRFEKARGGKASENLSLRDHFAAKAMQAAATNPTGAEGFTFEERARWAYQQADAMLKAREAA
jgi:hypothetical protein